MTVICIVQFLCNCIFTQLSPFYPVKAKERGLDTVFVGYVIEIMAIFQIFSSLLVTRCLNRYRIERY